VTQPSFGVDPQRLDLIVNNVEAVSGEIARVEGSLRSCPPAGDEVFAEYGASAAYREFFEQWTAEVGATAGAAHQLSGSIKVAADNYQQSDDAATLRFGTR
jgi:uncharacterized protein YukE